MIRSVTGRVATRRPRALLVVSSRGVRPSPRAADAERRALPCHGFRMLSTSQALANPIFEMSTAPIVGGVVGTGVPMAISYLIGTLANINSVAIPVSETKVSDVTVYVDRAEVTRVIEVVPKQVGPLAIKIQGVTDSADTNSIRVQGGGGVPATILEVSSAVSCGADESGESVHALKVEQLKAAVTKAQTEVSTIQAVVQRVEQQDNFLVGFVDAALGVWKTDDNGTTQPITDVTKAHDVFNFFETKATKLDESKRELQAKQKAAEAAVLNAELELAQYQTSINANKRSKDITVQLLTTEEANGNPIILRISYMVSGASWHPSYDLRASMDPASIQLTYHGMVKQSTGEDWIDARVRLSTALPASAGTPPVPPTQIVQWQYNFDRFQRHRENEPELALTSSRISKATFSKHMNVVDAEACAHVEDSVIASTTEIKSSGSGVATFEIEHNSTIESDSKEHKVTIAVMELEPNYEYFSTPALNDKAYLQARVVNTSEFPFLESDRGNIFLDGSFVTSTFINAASPNENFSIFLGVDPSIKLEHRQIKMSSSEGRAGSTFKFKSATDSTQKHEYVTTVTNTKKKPIKITIVQLLPRSTDDQISVDLVSPNPNVVKVQGEEATADYDVSKTSDATAIMEGAAKQFVILQNKTTNNLVYFGEIEPQGKRKIDYSYTICWPVTAGTGKIEVI